MIQNHLNRGENRIFLLIMPAIRHL
jgi:hypothetical protein